MRLTISQALLTVFLFAVATVAKAEWKPVVDLDNRRFELRNIDDDHILHDVRCIYGEKVREVNARKWLGESVLVQGRVQRDPDGRPRLMRLRHITVKGSDDQIMFDFSDED
jgi:hypothetical protein